VKIENGIKFNFETLKMKINGFSDLLISFLFKIQILNKNKKLISFSNLFFDFSDFFLQNLNSTCFQ
jgi:hypothetical protein